MSEIKVDLIDVNVDKLELNLKNPRTITKKNFNALKKSLDEFPSMLDVREIVVDENYKVLAGHQRLKALKSSGKTTIKVKMVSGWTDEEKDRFMVVDNNSNGDYDMDMLSSLFERETLEDWGLSLKIQADKDYKGLLNVELPTYEPKDGTMPEPSEMAKLDKVDKLVEEIEKSKASEDIKKIMKARACYFTDFNFQKIADYYVGADDETKELFKKLGLVIVRPREAFEMGLCDFRESFDD